MRSVAACAAPASNRAASQAAPICRMITIPYQARTWHLGSAGRPAAAADCHRSFTELQSGSRHLCLGSASVTDENPEGSYENCCHGPGHRPGRRRVRRERATDHRRGRHFPAPVYTKWGEAAKAAAGIELNYQAIGSGGGQNQILNRTVDFGASDAPMDPAKLAEGTGCCSSPP